MIFVLHLFSSTEKEASYMQKQRCILFFSFYPDREITENPFTVTKKILQKEKFPARAWASAKCYCGNKISLPALVANHNVEFGSSSLLAQLAI